MVKRVGVHCFIGAKQSLQRKARHLGFCQVTVELWLQCFHCRTDDERDTWCHYVGAKCRLSPTIWQMAICWVRRLVVCITKSLFYFFFPTALHKHWLNHMFCWSLSHYIISPCVCICVCLFHSGGLAERLNRLQCRQRSAISFWRHEFVSDTTAATTATGEPCHTDPLRILDYTRRFFFNVNSPKITV